MPFYRRRWAELRGDEHDEWGRAVYYVWVNEGVVEQQVERYDSGVTLAYDRYHHEDQHGQTTGEQLDPLEWNPYEIDIDTPTSARSTFSPSIEIAECAPPA